MPFIVLHPHIRLKYTVTDRSGEKTDYNYKVRLTTTPCNFGGVRYWFICPLSRSGVYCGKRAGKLYLPPSRYYFGCQHCYDLSYGSRNETRTGMIPIFGKVLTTKTKMEEFRSQMKRWTYRGKPTRKARRLEALHERFSKYIALSRPYLRRQAGSEHQDLSSNTLSGVCVHKLLPYTRIELIVTSYGFCMHPKCYYSPEFRLPPVALQFRSSGNA
jgi:hypothetical protein